MKLFGRQDSCVVRNQEYVGLPETEAALTEICFYHFRKHLLPENVFNIKQQNFFLSFLVLLPSILTYHWSISWIHSVSVQAACTSPAPRAPLPHSHCFWNISVAVLVWEGCPRCPLSQGRYNPQPGLLSYSGGNLEFYFYLCYRLAWQLWTKPVSSWKPGRGNSAKASRREKRCLCKTSKNNGVPSLLGHQ